MSITKICWAIAKNHPNKTVDMVDAIKIFGDWMKKYICKKNEN